MNKQENDLQNENGHLRALLSAVLTQERGVKNCWAGMWAKCENCTEFFAFGGNWRWHEHSLCPSCTANDFLTHKQNEFIDPNPKPAQARQE